MDRSGRHDNTEISSISTDSGLQCLYCTYNLTGIGSERCPECGVRHESLRKGGLHYGPMTHLCETFRRNQAGLVLPGKADRQPEASLALCWVTIMTKRRQRVHRPCDRASKEGYLWEPTSSASCTEGSIESP